MSHPLGIERRHPKEPCVYILASKPHGVLYIGVTSEVFERVALHKQGLLGGFTKRYGVHRLVYVEFHDDMLAAIQRETRLKKWNRAWKVRLIQQVNPEWVDLWSESGEIRCAGPGGQVLPGDGEARAGQPPWVPACAGMTGLQGGRVVMACRVLAAGHLGSGTSTPRLLRPAAAPLTLTPA